MTRRSIAGAGIVAAAGLLVAPEPALANPAVGEARSTLRDPDRVYSVVAGEGDGSSTVVNPANLGYLSGLNGVLDLGITAPSARRRGSGAGAFVGIPVPFNIVAFGLGYQFIFPVQPEGEISETDSPQNADDPFSKFTLALAVPLLRWVPGLSVGLGYSRLASATNFHANANQLDLAVSYWPNRLLALGLVGRGLNVPRTGDAGQIRQPLVVDPEVAFRPLGTAVIEVAGGVRLAPQPPADTPFNIFFVEPRVRLMSSFRGVRLFGELERYAYNPAQLAERVSAFRITTGVEVSFGHVGIAGAPILNAGGDSSFAAAGAALRVRVSQERYPTATVSPRKVTRVVLSAYRGDRGMWRAVEIIDDIAKRGGTLLVETRDMGLGWAQTEEVREAMLRLRASGGKVVVYMEGASMRSYFLASAADRIIANPNIKLGIIGMRIESFYYAELFEKLGIRAEFVRFAEYKSSPEHYEASTATEPSARQRLLMVGDTWNHALRIIARERGHQPTTVKGWIDEAPINPERARSLGIVDELAYRDELDARLEAWLDRPVRINKPDKRKQHVDRYGPPPRIAVVFLEGDMVDGESFTIPILGRKLAGSATLTETIEKLRKDSSVRAVVLRCNTRGGSVTAADEIARELDLTRKEKPVVISMSNACASGGFYAATAGQYIFADATTATGSIGVFQPKFDLSGGRALLGIGMDEFDLGANAGIFSHYKPYTPSERAAAEAKVAHDYKVFAGRVAAARNMTAQQVDDVARGRVWSGVRATEVGLVDAYGGLREAIMRARAIAGLPENRGFVELYPKPPGPLENLRALAGFRIPGPLADDADEEGPPRPFGALAPKAGTNLLNFLPLPILAVLRQLPVSLWLQENPGTMALMDEPFEILD